MIQTTIKGANDPATIVIYDSKKNQIYKDLSLIAADKKTGKVIDVGAAAMQAAGINQTIEAFCPLKHGMIADYGASAAMFRAMLKKIQPVKALFKPKIVICIPADLTEVEKKAFEDTFYQAGAKQVWILKSPMETINQAALPSCHLYVEILPDEKKKGEQKEVWKEIGTEIIPTGRYQIRLMQKDQTGMTVELSGDQAEVQIHFHGVIAMRMLEQRHIPERICLNTILDTIQKQSAPHLVYQITGGEFTNFLNIDRGENSQNSDKKHIIIISHSIIEVIAEGEPEIKVLPCGR